LLPPASNVMFACNTHKFLDILEFLGFFMPILKFTDNSSKNSQNYLTFLSCEFWMFNKFQKFSSKVHFSYWERKQ
jgi:hypothetical protein